MCSIDRHKIGATVGLLEQQNQRSGVISPLFQSIVSTASGAVSDCVAGGLVLNLIWWQPHEVEAACLSDGGHFRAPGNCLGGIVVGCLGFSFPACFPAQQSLVDLLMHGPGPTPDDDY